MTVDEGAARWTPHAGGPPTADPDDGKPEGVYARRTRIRKQEILDSALVAFGQKGFYKATLADVASAAGITAAGLLHHFKTKEALLVELLQQRDLVLSAEGVTDAHPARAWFLDRYQRLSALIATAIIDGASDGDFEPPVDVVGIASAIIAVMDGLQIQWLYDPDSVNMSEVTCRAINALVRPAVPLVPGAPATPPTLA
jgi:AcrR family transcriptional regulator